MIQQLGSGPDTSNSVLERASECSVCPAPVVRCAHFEGQVVRLAVHTKDNKLAGHVTMAPITLVVGTDSPAVCGIKHRVTNPHTFYEPFPDLPSAEAEFHRLEEELIRG